MNPNSSHYFFSRNILRIIICFFLALSVGTSVMYAEMAYQAKTVAIKGVVTDKSGNPVAGANIVEKGTINGTNTDAGGNYSLSVNGSESVLVVSFIGYETQEVAVGTKTRIDITLSEGAEMMDDVVVIGYGTQRKGDITSAVTSIKADDFLTGNVTDASRLIKGKVAGLVITRPSGDPNAASSINLRGFVSIQGSTNPLVLVDGIEGSLGTVPPENIVSIDVLKDASAAAIYGTRGASGVILITTKSGRRNESATVNYNAYASFSSFYKKADMMGPSDVRAGKTNYPDLGYDTDWIKGVTQTGYTHNQSVSITGGGKTTTYSANATYRKERGVMKSTGREEMKFVFDINQYFLKDVVKLNMNLVKGLHENDISDPAYAYRQAIIRNPTAPVYKEDGSYHEDFGMLQYYNPIAILKEKRGLNKSEYTRITGNLTVEPVKGWQTNLMVATNRSVSNDNSYTSSKHYTAQTDGHKGYVFREHYDSKSNYLELTSKYEANLDKHRISALAGYSYKESEWEWFNLSNRDFPTDDFLWYDVGGGTALKDGKAGMYSDKLMNKLIGFFGRVSYGYDNRYNVLVSLRHEGSSKFGTNKRWGSFPAVSLGWTISNESFMKDIAWLDHLKLRAGFGITGVEPRAPYLSKAIVRYLSDAWWFYNNKWNQGLGMPTDATNANPNLKWERTEEWNVGIDMSVLKNRVNINLDLYRKNTNDLLYDYRVPVPPNLKPVTIANVAKIRNQGFELMINAIPVRTKDFEWTTNLTMNHNATTLVSLSNELYETDNFMYTGYASDPISMETHRVDVGGAMGKFWGMRVAGITDDGKWLIRDPKTGEAVEYSEKIKSDKEYRQYLGTGLPKLTLGWSNSFTYRNFDLNFQMSGQFGHKILNGQRMFYENNSIVYNRLKSASKKIFGKAVLAKTMPQTFHDYYLENGDYLKMDNITLGYTFGPKMFNGWLSKIRVYASGDNLFCITKYKGLDPELATTIWGSGTDDRDKYPSIRSFTFGINVTF